MLTNREQTIQQIMMLLSEAGRLLFSLDEPSETTLATIGERVLGTDVSPNDLAPDELGCAESVTNIIRQAIPGFPIITGTWTLWDKLQKDDRFEQVDKPQAGDIIISPTGTVRNAPFPGHTGIMLNATKVMANHSESGEWSQDYTLKTWDNRWKKAGFPVLFYRLK